MTFRYTCRFALVSFEKQIVFFVDDGSEKSPELQGSLEGDWFHGTKAALELFHIFLPFPSREQLSTHLDWNVYLQALGKNLQSDLECNSINPSNLPNTRRSLRHP